VRERNKYRRCFARMMTDFKGANLLILCSKCFRVLRKYVVISSSRSNHAVTIQHISPAVLTVRLHHVAAMSFIWFGKCGEGMRNLSLKTGRDAAKITGEIPRINNCKAVIKSYAYIFQHTKHYLFYCSIYQPGFFLKDKTIKIVMQIRTVSSSWI